MPLSTNLHQRFIEQAAWTLEARKLFIENSGLLPNCKILEAGCGTGVVISSIQTLLDAQLFGIDIRPEMVQFAGKMLPQCFLVSADAGFIPFPENHFDAIVCHFLFLWVANPGCILREFWRVTRPGGVIALLAEPDYGSRIDYPPILEKAGQLQRESLIRQGANPDIGRQIGELLGQSGCINISTGILGSFQSGESPSDILLEQSVLRSDLSSLIDSGEIDRIFEIDLSARKMHSRVQFVPTFFGWGEKPE